MFGGLVAPDCVFLAVCLHCAGRIVCGLIVEDSRHSCTRDRSCVSSTLLSSKACYFSCMDVCTHMAALCPSCAPRSEIVKCVPSSVHNGLTPAAAVHWMIIRGSAIHRRAASASQRRRSSLFEAVSMVKAVLGGGGGARESGGAPLIPIPADFILPAPCTHPSWWGGRS